ncbi:MAG: hypothetical protein ISP24_01135 [Rickettsiales bacterium]|nr:hypothetical protein [Rickettsiales bacterium]
MKLFLLRFLIILPLFSCVEQKLTYKGDLLNQKIAKDKDIKAHRIFEAKSLSLKEKEEYFFNRFSQKFIKKPEYLIKRFIDNKNNNYESHIDDAAFFLSYLALKYANDRQEKYQDLALKILDGIFYLENIDGFNGYMPRFVSGDANKITNNDVPIRTNSYAILSFAYFLAYENFNSLLIKNKIKKHYYVIAKYFLDRDLNLETPDGVDIKYASLDAKFITSRQLDGVAFFEVANKILADSDLSAEIDNILHNVFRKKYRKKGKKISSNIMGFWDLATPSSNWLNFLKLYIAVKASNDAIYKNMFANYYLSVESEKNAFYDLLYIDIFSREKTSKISNILVALNSFPLTLNDIEIINSHNKKIPINKFSKIRKNKRYVESKIPLLIYNRPLTYHEWKHNQFRVNGNFSKNGELEFSGLDYLLAYSFLEKINK